MSLPEITTREGWHAARVELLQAEKAMTKARDELSSKRRMLPMVRVEKDYTFEGPDGAVALDALFGEHRQLIVQHFMFDPEWEDGCQSCTAAADELSPGLLRHLDVRDTAFAVVSRAPLEKIQRYQTKRGTEWLGGSYAFLDTTPLGRQEDWEEPKGRTDAARAAIPDFSS